MLPIINLVEAEKGAFLGAIIMAKTRVQKEQTVKSLTEKLTQAKSVVFADYKGLNMSKLSELREKLREVGAEFSITKNTLLDLAFKQAKMPEVSPEIKSGPTATLFSYEDEIGPLKLLVKTLKDAQIGPSTSLRIKGGFLDNQFLESVAINCLATLPGKQELRGQAVGLLASPLKGMVGVLQGNLRNLVYTLSAIQKVKGGESS